MSYLLDGRMISGHSNFAGEVSFLPFGMSREAQLEQLNTEDGLYQLAVDVVISIIAIMNPASIAITGEAPSENMVKRIQQGCRERIPEEHMPELFLKQGTQKEYMKGLIAETFKSLS